MNSKKIYILLNLCFLFLLTSSIGAEMHHGLSRYGHLKYPQDFKSFDYVNSEAPKGGDLKVAVLGNFDTLSRTINGTPPDGIELTFDTLLVKSADEPFSMYGLIAESIEVAPDHSWVIFNLRPEAQFHDGSPITPEDIIFSWESQRTKGIPAARTHYSKVKKAEKIGPRSVKFTFKNEDGYLDFQHPLIMGMMPIYSQKDWEGKTFDAVTLTPFLGSGPYYISKAEPGRFIEYTRVQNYWARNLPVRKGLHNFDRIRYEYYRNAYVALEAFKSGHYDFIQEHDLRKWKSSYQGPAFTKGHIKKVEMPHKRPVGIKGFVFNMRRDIFKDRRVREALTLMFDFEWMNKNLFENGFKRTQSYYENAPFKAQGKPLGKEKELLLSLPNVDPKILEEEALLPPVFEGTGHNRKAHTKALSLLKDAGWDIKNGILTHLKSGEPFVFEILLTDPSLEKTALAFIQSLKKIGIKAKIKTVDPAQYEKRRCDWDFDMIYNWWASSLSPGVEQRIYWTQKAADTPGMRNYSNIREESVDILVEKIACAASEEDVTIAARALDRILRRGLYLIPLYYSDVDRFAYWDKFERPSLHPEIGPLVMGWWAKGKK